MNWKNTAALAVVAAAIGGWAYWESKQGPVQEPNPNQVVLWKLSDDQAKGLSTITIQRATASAEYRQVNGKWHLASQATRDLDPMRWDSTFDGLKKVTGDRKVADQVGDPRTYGLAAASMSLKIAGAKEAHVVQVGDKTPSGTDYYAQVQGDKALYTVPSYVVDTWGRLITDPPLAALPTPAPNASAAVRPAAPAPGTPGGPAAGPRTSATGRH